MGSARWPASRRRGQLVLIFVTLFAVFELLFALAPNLWLGMLLIVFLGVFPALYATLADTLIQTVVEDEYRGRVMAFYSTFWGFTPVGYLQAGLIARVWGVQTAIFVNGCVVLVYVLALARLDREMRSLA